MRLGSTSLSATRPGAVRKLSTAAAAAGGGTFPNLDTYSHERFEYVTSLNLLDVYLSSDGTKIWYLAGNGLRTFYQRNLSTPFDVSTMGSVQAQKDLRVSTNLPYRYVQDTYFKPDGTQLFAASYYGIIVAWDLSTAFDVSTAVFSQSKSWSASYGGSPRLSGLTFKPDGTKMFWADPDDDRIYQATLTTAWDPSTATSIGASAWLNSSSGSIGEPSVWGLQFSPDGNKLYVLGGSNDKMYQANLNTAWDVTISSSSWDGTADYEFDFSSQENAPGGFFIGGSSGQHFYLAGYQGDGIDQYVST